jgi:hypothetical protein
MHLYMYLTLLQLALLLLLARQLLVLWQDGRFEDDGGDEFECDWMERAEVATQTDASGSVTGPAIEPAQTAFSSEGVFAAFSYSAPAKEVGIISVSLQTTVIRCLSRQLQRSLIICK